MNKISLISNESNKFYMESTKNTQIDKIKDINKL